MRTLFIYSLYEKSLTDYREDREDSLHAFLLF